MNNVVSGIDKLLTEEIASRTVGGTSAFTEEEAKRELDPFFVEGKSMRDKIIADMKAHPTAYPAGLMLTMMNMTDDQLAELGYVVCDYETNPQLVYWGLNKWGDCLLSTFGITNDIIDVIRTGGKYITAKIGFKIAKMLRKRLWVGSAQLLQFMNTQIVLPTIMSD